MKSKYKEFNHEGITNVHVLGLVLYKIHCRLYITMYQIIDLEGKVLYK
jgi:hypothetical protein